ncbi:MAG: Nramp family divalent metal transporter, partial [Halobacteria archaeon]|nr:Nramp family divalent metal transporter [Halobacteria archaeon]
QLATGTTLLEGWVHRLPVFFSLYFFIYLLLWTFIVAAALIAATGLAAHALVPSLAVQAWGVIEALLAVVLVVTGRYALLERLMKTFMALMMVVVILCAILVIPESEGLLDGLLRPSIPDGSALFIFGVIGGVGGSVTLMCYGYWIRERGWISREDLARSRTDLAVAYILTGLFGMAIMIVSAGVSPEQVTGPEMALSVAKRLELVVGPVGMSFFLVGFWCAVFSSMLGVWQGIPYLFADFVQQYTLRGKTPREVDTRSMEYRAYLVYIAIPPMALLLAGKPVWLVIIYAVAGAFFMPLLGIILLFLNNRRQWLGDLRNGIVSNLLLLSSVLVFVLVMYDKIVKQFG